PPPARCDHDSLRAAWRSRAQTGLAGSWTPEYRGRRRVALGLYGGNRGGLGAAGGEPPETRDQAPADRLLGLGDGGGLDLAADPAPRRQRPRRRRRQADQVPVGLGQSPRRQVDDLDVHRSLAWSIEPRGDRKANFCRLFARAPGAD